jgi:hypothetical protein
MVSRWTTLLCVLLTGCDAWPTTVDNRSPSTIQFAWHHADYDQWSAPFELPAGKAIRLALNHYAADFTGVRISEGEHTYALTPEAIDRLHKFCSRTAMERTFNLGGDCWLTYRGNGWVTVARHAAADITLWQPNSGS